MALLHIYRAASRPMKCQFWMTLAMGGFLLTVTASGQATAPAPEAETIFTFQNFIAALSFAYGVGMTVQNFREQGRRLDKIEKFIEETLPETYARKDVLESRLGRRETDPVVVRKSGN
jgi:hypothetical protein